MKNKIFMALLLAGALVITPISGSFTGLHVSANTATSDVSGSDVSGGDQGGGTETPGGGDQGGSTETPGGGDQGGDVSGGDQGGSTETPGGSTETPGTSNFDQAMGELEDLINSGTATEEQLQAKVEEVKNALVDEVGGKEALAESMMTDDTASAVSELETAYLQVMNREATKVIPEESVGIEASQITVVGAGLNDLKDGVKCASLEVKKTAESPALPANFNSDKTVLLEINLAGVKDSKNLQYPVMITIPVPSGFSAANVAVLHYADGTDKQPTLLRVNRNDDNTISFCVSSFSVFAFTEVKQADCGSDDDDDDNGSTGSGSGAGYAADMEAQIAMAAKGATVKVTGINTLPNSVMKELLERKDVTLVMEYTYDGRAYTITIPAGTAIDNDIPWYGPLYLASYYGNGAVAANGFAYIVKSGDTMSQIAKANRMTLSQLAAKNPQIKNIDMIRVGQKINLK